MSYVIPSWELTSLPVVDSEDRFPVRRIYCIGRNYAEHAREMGMDERDPPFFFMKPTDAIVQNGAKIPYPPQTKNYHYEGELVVAIGDLRVISASRMPITAFTGMGLVST